MHGLVIHISAESKCLLFFPVVNTRTYVRMHAISQVGDNCPCQMLIRELVLPFDSRQVARYMYELCLFPCLF